MYYKLCCSSEYDEAFLLLIRKISKPCSESEFQFLNKNKLNWIIAEDADFAFEDIFYVNQKVLIISKTIWDKALSVVDSDEIFQIPLIINQCGEQHYYTIVVPSRINCLDNKGRIIPKNVGRYHIFKSKDKNDSSIYISERLMIELKDYTTIKFKGVI
jgi:hypothetical protein